MRKVETDIQPKNGLCCHRRPIFIQSLCELLFLHYSMLVGLSEAVNMDDIERSNVNPLCHLKQKDLLDLIKHLSDLDHVAFSVSGGVFCSSHYM